MAKLPPIEPHTAAKHMILRRYLDAWFPILGRSHNRINYVDGFAGAGEYESGEKGSPIHAIESAIAHYERKTLRSDAKVNFFFIERDSESSAHLSGLLERINVPETFHIRVDCGEFREVIGQVLDSIDSSAKLLAPSLFFVDPFGFSGIPFRHMQRILSYPRCEVFINIMVEHINRFLHHPEEKISTHLLETFGTNQVLDIPNSGENRTNALLALYRSQLRVHAKFVERFDMRTGLERRIYSLFFASNSNKGFLKMKEAMWSVDKHQGSSFSDRDPKGYFKADLFGFDPLWDEVQKQFNGKTVPMSVAEKFVIEETRFLPSHLRKILGRKEESGDIRVTSLDSHKRRRGTFPAGKVQIEFMSK